MKFYQQSHQVGFTNLMPINLDSGRELINADVVSKIYLEFKTLNKVAFNANFFTGYQIFFIGYQNHRHFFSFSIRKARIYVVDKSLVILKI